MPKPHQHTHNPAGWVSRVKRDERKQSIDGREEEEEEGSSASFTLLRQCQTLTLYIRITDESRVDPYPNPNR